MNKKIIDRERNDNDLRNMSFDIQNADGEYTYNLLYLVDKIKSRSLFHFFVGDRIILGENPGYCDIDGAIYVKCFSSSEWSSTEILIEGWIPFHETGGGMIEIMKFLHVGETEEKNFEEIFNFLETIKIKIFNGETSVVFNLKELAVLSSKSEYENGIGVIEEFLYELIGEIGFRRNFISNEYMEYMYQEFL